MVARKKPIKANGIAKMVCSNFTRRVYVLYLHFKKPNHADNSEMTEDEIIVRYENKEIIGMTILNASQRK